MASQTSEDGSKLMFFIQAFLLIIKQDKHTYCAKTERYCIATKLFHLFMGGGLSCFCCSFCFIWLQMPLEEKEVQYLSIQSCVFVLPVACLLTKKHYRQNQFRQSETKAFFLSKTTNPLGPSWADCQGWCLTLCIQWLLTGLTGSSPLLSTFTVIKGCNSSLGLRRFRLTA